MGTEFPLATACRETEAWRVLPHTSWEQETVLSGTLQNLGELNPFLEEQNHLTRLRTTGLGRGAAEH